jgi:Tfp pilus assembly protein PilO
MSLQVGTLDRRYAIALLAGLGAFLLLKVGPFASQDTTIVAPIESVSMAERRLEKVRQAASTVPARETILKQAQAEVATRENGLLKGDTKAQAQAQLIELVQSVAKANGVETHGVERMTEGVVNADYGEVGVEVAFTCGIEQLVNLLASLADQPQILATDDVRISGGTDKKKMVQVRLAVSGIVPRKLLPEKKAGTNL